MDNVKKVEPIELFKLIPQPKVMVVDVRNELALLNTGKIPHAIHIPLSNLPISYKKLIESNHVIFYCDNGAHSSLAADYAVSKGIKNISILNGGISAWVNAGFTLVTKQQ